MTNDALMLAAKANSYLESNTPSRPALAKYLGISTYILDTLAKKGLIPKCPPKMTASQAATLGRKMGNPWGTKFRLKGSPVRE